jgi:hypothetical protein
MKYKCDRCLKEFTQKSNFDVHIHRKNPCKNNKELFNDLSINTPQKNAKLALKNQVKL